MIGQVNKIKYQILAATPIVSRGSVFEQEEREYKNYLNLKTEWPKNIKGPN